MTSHELANHLLMQPDLPDCVCVKRSEVAESDHLYAIDQLTKANAALRDVLRDIADNGSAGACVKAQRALAPEGKGGET